MAARWTPQEDKKLAMLWASNVPAKDIGQQLGRSLTRVWARTRDLGLPARNLRIGDCPEVRVKLPFAMNKWVQREARVEGKTRNEFIISVLRSRMHVEIREMTKALAERKGAQR